MIVVSPELFEKFKTLQTSVEAHLVHLDKELKKILRDKSIDEDEKWYSYRQLLNNYSNKRRNLKNMEDKNGNVKMLHNEHTQTNLVSTRNKSIMTDTKETNNQCTNTENEIESYFKTPNFIQETSLVEESDLIEDAYDDRPHDRRLSVKASANKLKKKLSKKPADLNKSYEIIDVGDGSYATVSKNLADNSIEELDLNDGTVLKKQSSPKPKRRNILKPSTNIIGQNCLNFPVRKVTRSSTRNQSGRSYFQWENYM